MNWYSAHIIISHKLKEDLDQTVLVWENVVLFRGNTVDEVKHKATDLALRDAGDDDGTLKWNEKPAIRVFEGIRKIVECDCPTSPDIIEEGTEVTYSEIYAIDKNSLRKLVDGDCVDICYY